MVHSIKYLLLLFLASSCIGKADIANMFVSDQSVNDRFQQSQSWNEIHGFSSLYSESENYEILVFGDSHLGDTINLGKLFQDAESNTALAVVMNGDITSGKVEDYATLVAFLDNHSGVKSFPVPGNHDLYFNGWEEYYKKLGSGSYYFEVKTPKTTDIFYCLDTGSGTLGKDQYRWFKDHLSQNRYKYQQCIVITHNNLFRFRKTFSTSPMVEEIRELLELFRIYQVNMVVNGHDHVRGTEEFVATRHIIMDALQDINPDASYLKIQKSADSLHYSFTDL